jgi:putative zinc finger protein
MNNEQGHLTREQLLGHVDGTLSDALDRVVEGHLRSCSECAALVDGYVQFIAEAEEASAAPASEELLAAVARLDRRMAPALSPDMAPEPSGALAWLCRIHAIHALLRADVPRLGELLRSLARPGPARRVAVACESARPGSVVLDDVATLHADGSQGRTSARLEELARGQDSLELLVELDLQYAGWNAGIAYLLAPGSGAEQAGLALYSGRVDEEGLIEFRSPWPGMPTEPFDPRRLKICLLAPGAREPPP